MTRDQLRLLHEIDQQAAAIDDGAEDKVFNFLQNLINKECDYDGTKLLDTKLAS